MNNTEIVLLIILLAIITIIMRIGAVYINMPNNKLLNKYFDALPITVLTILVFPEIFTSIGTDYKSIAIIAIGILVVVYTTLKKYDLGKVIAITVATLLLSTYIIL